MMLKYFLITLTLLSPILKAEKKYSRVEGISLVKKMLTSKQWSMRAFALMRAERFAKEKEGLKKEMFKALKDENWQVRCFALYSAKKMSYEIPASLFVKEKNLRVIRTALYLGVKLDMGKMRSFLTGKLSSRNPRELITAFQICALSDNEKLRVVALSKLKSTIRGIKKEEIIAMGPELAQLLGVPTPANAVAWRNLSRNKTIKLQAPAALKKKFLDGAPSKIAGLEEGKFHELAFYLDELQKQEIDVVVAIDGTGSMGGAISRVQRQISQLILLLNALSKSMQAGIVIYRDKGFGKVQTEKLTDNIVDLQKFLFKVNAFGGGDIPESVLSALKKVDGLGWRKGAEKQLIIIADAPPHAHEMEEIHEKIDEMKRYENFTTHCLDCGKQSIKELKKIAEWGAGHCPRLGKTDDIGKLIMKLSLDERVAPYFDDFYDLYVKLCM